MTKEDVRKILMILDATFASFNVSNPESMVDAWYYMLQDFSTDEILMGLKTYITTQGSAYAPSVSELIAMTRKPQELTQLEEVDAWAQVRKAIKRGIYHSKEDFDQLPEEAKKVVARPEQLCEWAQLPSEEIDTVVRSNFRRSYEIMQKRTAEIAAMPKEVRQLIQETTAKQIEEKYVTRGVWDEETDIDLIDFDDGGPG